MSDGVVLTADGRRLCVFSDSEIFGMTKLRRTSRRRAVKREALLSELAPGDYVVHVEHGVGRFVGSGRASQDEGDREYLILEYARGDQLYVPMEHVDRVTPYVAPMEKPPSLTRLGTQEWKRAKERVAESTREMAAELLSLYASRELAEGHAYSPDTPWQSELESSFPYEETKDQQETIVQVKSDMEHPVPMDRLVCGDVGYGKTEVALRAAFKAVMGGKQVAVLVPTTVLAQQHYSTFSERLQAFPVSVEVLSRFRTDSEQRRVVEGLAAGKVDICIGTHRLIQKDVAFKDLGLVIVDEEQRFGVAHKERLKEMRREVDVLTLTATPIPRTLHLSLAGVRDMSRIETPPEERLPIKTYVSEFSDELIREAIRREIDRQGQVFFVHNRVYNIDYMAGYIRMLVPEAEVAVGHGQMPEHELERAMLGFAEGSTDVLVCTTIIESGLDIPNANALIINRADTFGLAQLYQLRGRIGRGARRAYAYLLVPAHRSINEVAEKRLKTMLAATELGRRIPDRHEGPGDPRRRQRPRLPAERTHRRRRLRPLHQAAERGRRVPPRPHGLQRDQQRGRREPQGRSGHAGARVGGGDPGRRRARHPRQHPGRLRPGPAHKARRLPPHRLRCGTRRPVVRWRRRWPTGSGRSRGRSRTCSTWPGSG